MRGNTSFKIERMKLFATLHISCIIDHHNKWIGV